VKLDQLKTQEDRYQQLLNLKLKLLERRTAGRKSQLTKFKAEFIGIVTHNGFRASESTCDERINRNWFSTLVEVRYQTLRLQRKRTARPYCTQGFFLSGSNSSIRL
jgi:hypothetical protein